MRLDASRQARIRPGLRRRTLAADSLAVFDSRSWRTHIVGGVAAMLLTLFAERGAHRLDALADALQLTDPEFSRDDMQQLVNKALSELYASELIEFVPDAPATSA